VFDRRQQQVVCRQTLPYKTNSTVGTSVSGSEFHLRDAASRPSFLSCLRSKMVIKFPPIIASCRALAGNSIVLWTSLEKKNVAYRIRWVGKSPINDTGLDITPLGALTIQGNGSIDVESYVLGRLITRSAVFLRRGTDPISSADQQAVWTNFSINKPKFFFFYSHSRIFYIFSPPHISETCLVSSPMATWRSICFWRMQILSWSPSPLQALSHLALSWFGMRLLHRFECHQY